jgi:hypothetical protein
MEKENTSGFYKKEGDEWFHAPNFVESSNYILVGEFKDSYNYPIDGWTWHEEAPSEFIAWKKNNQQ